MGIEWDSNQDNVGLCRQRLRAIGGPTASVASNAPIALNGSSRSAFALPLGAHTETP